eukprot:scaffold3187_cov361-Prasinococcus_capsulatus_cf.AAC.16
MRLGGPAGRGMAATAGKPPAAPTRWQGRPHQRWPGLAAPCPLGSAALAAPTRMRTCAGRGLNGEATLAKSGPGTGQCLALRCC